MTRVFRRVEMGVGQAARVVTLADMAGVVDRARELGAPDGAEVTRCRDALLLGHDSSVVFAIEWETTADEKVTE